MHAWPVLRFSIAALVLSAGLFVQSASAQSDTIAAKKPVFAGACAMCPWGELAEFTREAMVPLGYQVQVCNICNLIDSPRYVSERRMPPPITERHRTLYGVTTRPESPVDFGVTEKMRAHWAYHGIREYTGDTTGKRLRLIALIEDPTYVVVAVRKGLNSTDLKDILARPNLRLRSEGNTPVQVLLSHYGTSKADIEKRGGTFEAPAGFETAKKPFDIIITPMGSLANNPEANAFYNLPPTDEVVFVSLPEDLRDRLVNELGYVRVNLPISYFRGVSAPVATVGRSGNAIIARDDTPEAFVYDVAKAVDLHRDRLKWFIRPYSYDSRNVWKAFDIPLHPGAERYYREVGYMK